MKNLIVFTLLASAVVLHAQDAIYKKDKTKLDGKVTEVGEWLVKYKPSSNPDGPVYSLPKTDIAIIIYQNGTSDIFSRETRNKKFDSLSVNFCRNSIGMDIGEFSHTAINMTYERVLGKKGSLALRVPFSVGIMSSNYYYSRNKIFSIGTDLLFFPTGQGKLRYFAAPYAEFGMYRNNYYYLQGFSERFMAGYYSYGNYQLEGGVKNGIQYSATRHFSVSADLGFGIRGSVNRYSYVIPATRGNFILAYRF